MNDKRFNIFLQAVITLSLTATGWSQDVLVTQGANSTDKSKRQGVITEWLGHQITLEQSGRARQIDSNTVVEIQTKWPDSYQQATDLMQQRRFDEAVGPLQTAINAETRPWAQRAIGGKLIECYLSTGNEALAIDEFVAIARDDPNTRFYNLAPLPWVSTVAMGNISRHADAWMESAEPVEKLMGAAWSLSGPQRNTAIAALKELSGGQNSSVAALAKSQLWRTESISAKSDTLRRWKSELNVMPRPVRAGAYLMLADAQARNKMEDEAATNLMRIAVLYPEQHGLAATALYRCANLRQNAGHTDESRTLWAEILRNYSNTIWAKQASAHLNESNSKN